MGKTVKFDEFNLSKRMISIINKKGFEVSTPVQREMIPLLLEKDIDIIAKAQTGTGKTAAFGLPLLDKLKFNKKPKILVITPTRELAIQVSDELNSLKPSKSIRIRPVYGGTSIDRQLRDFKEGLDVVVGTPGRIMDHIRRNKKIFENIEYLILDEADEMLSMGFIEDMEFVILNSNKDKNILLMSATMPSEIIKLSKKFLKNPERIEIKSSQLTTDLTKQIYFEVRREDKFEAITRIIDIELDFYGLIFCRTKIGTDELAQRLNERGYKAEALHGDISQNQRERILNKFKSKNIKILAATDVAARGLDVVGLTHVINYSIPQDPESYVHRIGRTGRAGAEGTAITFITPAEYRRLQLIKKITKSDIEKGKVPKVGDIIELKQEKILNLIDSSIFNSKEEIYYKMAEKLLENNNPRDILATLIEMNYSDALSIKKYSKISEEALNQKGKARLFIAKGKKDNFTKKTLIDYIVRESGIKESKIREIRVLDKFSFVTVGFIEAEQVMKAFKNKKVGRQKIIEYAKK